VLTSAAEEAADVSAEAAVSCGTVSSAAVFGCEPPLAAPPCEEHAAVRQNTEAIKQHNSLFFIVPPFCCFIKKCIKNGKRPFTVSGRRPAKKAPLVAGPGLRPCQPTALLIVPFPCEYHNFPYRKEEKNIPLISQLCFISSIFQNPIKDTKAS
jgi:hypothetical protein